MFMIQVRNKAMSPHYLHYQDVVVAQSSSNYGERHRRLAQLHPWTRRPAPKKATLLDHPPAVAHNVSTFDSTPYTTFVCNSIQSRKTLLFPLKSFYLREIGSVAAGGSMVVALILTKLAPPFNPPPNTCRKLRLTGWFFSIRITFSMEVYTSEMWKIPELHLRSRSWSII